MGLRSKATKTMCTAWCELAFNIFRPLVFGPQSKKAKWYKMILESLYQWATNYLSGCLSGLQTCCCCVKFPCELAVSGGWVLHVPSGPCWLKSLKIFSRACQAANLVTSAFCPWSRVNENLWHISCGPSTLPWWISKKVSVCSIGGCKVGIPKISTFTGCFSLANQQIIWQNTNSTQQI